MARLHLHEVAVPFRRPLVTGDGIITTRRSVLVGFAAGGMTGWGEAAAFPSGRWGTADEAWDALLHLEPGEPPRQPLAAAALQAARNDHAARLRGIPLAVSLGGAVRPVAARLTTGLAETPPAMVIAVNALVAAGAVAVKVKVAPGRDLEPLQALRHSHPDLAISVDANGSYLDPDDPVFTACDDLGVDLVEQPFPPGELAACARLRTRIAARVCIDEDLRSVDDAARVLAAGAADVLALKVMRLGHDTAATILEMCRGAGVGVKAGGTFDTAVGRHHVLAFATRPGVTEAEAGPPAGYLDHTFGPYPDFAAGTITPFDAPGIGMDPDPDRLAGAIRSAVVEWAP